MANKLNLRLFFFLHVRCLVSYSLLVGLQDTNPQNTTIFNFNQYNNKTKLQPKGVILQTTTIRQAPSTVMATSGQNTSKTSHHSHGNGTSGILHNLEESDMNNTKHQPADNESMAVTESPPLIKHSLNPVMPSSASTLSSTLGGNGTNTTNTSLVRATGHMVTEERSTSITTKPVAIPFTKIQTTLDHQLESTQKTATKVCTTAEPKGDNLVGRCLLAIGSLAAITIIFIMTTIILATKQVGSRHRRCAGLPYETEMVCISTLMNDSDYPIPTPRRPKSNGALISITEGEDGDDLTLNSFLHDTDGVP